MLSWRFLVGPGKAPPRPSNGLEARCAELGKCKSLGYHDHRVSLAWIWQRFSVGGRSLMGVQFSKHRCCTSTRIDARFTQMLSEEDSSVDTRASLRRASALQDVSTHR